MQDNYLSNILNQKYKMDTDMLKLILDSVPANVFFKDTKCRYLMASHVCKMLNGCGKDWTIIGKTDLEVQKDLELGKFYYEDDKKIMETRKGNHYVSEMIFDGEKYYYEIIKEPVIDIDGNVLGVIGLVNDVTELKKLQEALRISSIMDKLTGAYNRNYYDQRLKELSSEDYSELSIIMCDSNNLKYINDRYGHQKGDALLEKTVSIIKEVIGNEGEIIRTGGDEFIILCLNCSENHCKELVKQIKSNETTSKLYNVPISNSYGYVTIVKGSMDLEEAVSVAEKQMYKDKSRIKANFHKYLG